MIIRTSHEDKLYPCIHGPYLGHHHLCILSLSSDLDSFCTLQRWRWWWSSSHTLLHGPMAHVFRVRVSLSVCAQGTVYKVQITFRRVQGRTNFGCENLPSSSSFNNLCPLLTLLFFFSSFRLCIFATGFTSVVVHFKLNHELRPKCEAAK